MKLNHRLPWKVLHSEITSIDDALIGCVYSGGQSSDLLAKAVSASESDDNAAFIVRACNAHDDLVDALQGAIAYIGDDSRSDRRRLENLRCMTDALIKAKL